MAWSRVNVGTAPPDVVRVRDVVSYPSVPAKLGWPSMPKVVTIPRQRKNLVIERYRLDAQGPADGFTESHSILASHSKIISTDNSRKSCCKYAATPFARPV